MSVDKPEVEQTSFRLEKALLKEVRRAVVDRDITLQEAAAEALRMWLDGKVAPSQKDPSHPPLNGDMLTFNPAKLGTDWTEKEAADAQAFIDMRRAHDELSTSTLDTLLNRWKLIHGAETEKRRNDKRRRA